MERLSRFRAQVVLLIFFLVIGFFGFTMFNLQVIETEGKVDNTTTYTTITRVKAARGDILDRNGNKLVGNRASYDLVLNHYVILSTEGTNQHLYNLIKTCEENGIPYEDHFPVSSEKPFVYTLDNYNSTWRSYFQIFLDYQDGIDSDITAPLLIEKLKDLYDFPEEWTEDEIRKVIGLRYELSLRNCVSSLSNYVFMADADDDILSLIVELNIPGMNVEASTVREYYTPYAAHVLGHVGAMNAEQWEEYKDKPGYEMDTLIGQSGLELAYEEYLHGTDGWREDTVAADGTLISSRYLTEPKAGANVEISIDQNVQMIAETRLAAAIEGMRGQEGNDGKDVEGGAVVAIDVKTGQILACANYPTYDPADYYEKYDELLEAEFSPLTNRALQTIYPPGSAYKMVPSIAAMESKAITPETRIYDSGVFDKYSGLTLYCLAHTSYGVSHGDINVAEALMYSCNYFYYTLGELVSIEKVDYLAKQLGLGEPTGVELPESVGYRANEETKKELYSGTDRVWVMGDQLPAMIGQSDNRFTPLQLAVYTAALANKGVRYKATFMNRVVSTDYQELLAENKPTVLSKLDMQESTINAIHEGMFLVTWHRDGTAYNQGAWRYMPVNTAGKTSTAQQFWGEADNGAFVCFAPLEDPQIAIAIYGEKAAHGSTLASIARAMILEYLNMGTVSEVTPEENRIN